MPQQQPGLAQCTKHSFGGLGALGGPGASQEMALLQQDCPSWSHHTLGVHPSHWDRAARAGPGNQMKSYLEKISAPQGLQWREDSSLHKESHKPQPVPVPCESSMGWEAELGLEPAQVSEPSTHTLPSKAGIY